MSESNSRIVERAVSSLGKGFDLTSDFRLKYCKGKERLVLLNDADKRPLAVPGFRAVDDVSSDIKCDKGDRIRYQSDVLNFNQMSEFFNQKSSLPGNIPSGLFNSMFGFQSGSWATDAANVKNLGLDGYFIILFNVHIDRYPLVLSDEVRNAVPSSWDPRALARFIETYGTHIVVGLSMGGQDVVLVKEDTSSNLGPSELKKHLDELGDQLFTGTCNFSPLLSKTKENKLKAPLAFNVFDPQPMAFNSFASMNTKDGITVICSKRGGVPSTNSHCEWLLTVSSMPDAINFSFIPITSLLKGVSGKDKPPIADLQYFLDFQAHKSWAPIYNDLPLGPTTNRATTSPAIQFNMMGPKLYVNTNQVTVEKRPVTGMRLYLEGMKCNRLAIHLQHLTNCPIMLQNKVHDTPIWRGSEDIADHDQYLEAINGKKFSHICTMPIKYNPKWTSKKHVAFIVTGAQLIMKKQESKNVLHLQLLFSRVLDCFIVQSNWAECSSEFSQKSGIFSAITTSFSGNNQLFKEKQPAVIVDSGVFPTGPPVSQRTQKLFKFVDTSHLCRGPQDNPGHWLVTGARLYVEKGKIGLHVKFSLLNICS
ncbi:Membrane attack complex component/perforin (MACPF) domain containing protein [Parasponia andersonii]|uniref:Membrane attack complex component/perforin (MACPF) domain containing protein n=1 Tax=Parasponia andersonii TaxID=3476 RepID=A0A2P5D284_PARAD|nr:Membrane attack complex component/perforin (MACPF) domain containing protein [Parasponia andersonii]